MTAAETFIATLAGIGIDASGIAWGGDGSMIVSEAVPQSTRDVVLAAWAAANPVAAAIAYAVYAACADIDACAAEARKRYVTAVAGQEMTYLVKAQQAQAYKAAGYPAASIASYPFVQAKAQAMNVNPGAIDYQVAADLILATQASWITLGAQMELAREKGKADVRAATTTNAIAAARDAAVSALNAL